MTIYYSAVNRTAAGGTARREEHTMLQRVIMTLTINCTTSYEISSRDKTIRTVLFDGYARGDYFNGTIMPGAVDTQECFPDGSGTLSARYILKGTDFEGKECSVFIENAAALGSVDTSPVIVTDSDALSWLNHADLTGKMCFGEVFNIIISEIGGHK